jgi:translation elongation factor EF-1alpha
VVCETRFRSGRGGAGRGGDGATFWLLRPSLLEIIEHKSTISSGYSANLHIHAAVAAIQLKELIALIDRKTGAIIEEHPRFIKQDQTAIARFELSTVGQSLCMEIFECYPQLGTFTLHGGERTVALGKVLKIIE